MEERDGLENHRRELARGVILTLPKEQRQAAQEQEDERMHAYENDKELLLQARQAHMSTVIA